MTLDLAQIGMPPPERPSPWACRHCDWVFDRRIQRVILHDTGSRTAESALRWFGNPDSKVSAHVVIERDGTIWRVVPDHCVAWHARGANRDSLGVELVDWDDRDPYPEEQLRAAAEWVAWRCRLHRLPVQRVIGHVHVAPGRKVDPGPDFPWGDFRARLRRLGVADEADRRNV